MPNLITITTEGHFCEAREFYIDPWRPVSRAVITHSDSDHVRRDCGRYLTTEEGLRFLPTRMGPSAELQTLKSGEPLVLNGDRVSFHPTGAHFGSAQIRVVHQWKVWTIFGDDQTAADTTCTPIRSEMCHTLITKGTFALPINRWPEQTDVFEEVHHWWRATHEAGPPSVVFASALGRTQRVLSGLDRTIAPIPCHGAVEQVDAYGRRIGISLLKASDSVTGASKRDCGGAPIMARPSLNGIAGMKTFGKASTAFVSGRKRSRGTLRRGVDREFVLSNHADWPGLISAAREAGAVHILGIHGHSGKIVRLLTAAGDNTGSLHTEFVEERDELGVDLTADKAILTLREETINNKSLSE